MWARNQAVLARTQAQWGQVKEIGLPGPENLNAHVHSHRRRRGISEPRGCDPSRLSFANFIFGELSAQVLQWHFPRQYCSSAQEKISSSVQGLFSLHKDFLMMINSLYKGSIPCSQEHNSTIFFLLWNFLNSSVLPCISGENKTELFEGLCIVSARLQGQRSLNPKG